MNYTEVGICNMALGLLGEETITAFDSSSTRARLCEVHYVLARDRLLELADWSFARKYSVLQQLVVTTSTPVPAGFSLYGIPADCLVPRDFHPPGTQINWEVLHGGILVPETVSGLGLYYTYREVSPSRFTAGFTHLLSLDLGAKLARPLTGDSKLAQSLVVQYAQDKEDILGRDANVGSHYRPPDNDFNSETFINPDYNANTATT